MRILLLRGAVLLGLAIVVITEGLSLLNVLNRTGILFAWTLVLAAALVALYRTPRRRAVLAFCVGRVRAFVRVLRGFPLRLVLVLLLSFFVFMVAVVAWSAPPNTFDSMTYHMARVAHWIQNANVTIYPTPISRQYEYPAFTEYAILHLQLATVSDRFANLVQFGAYVGAILGVSVIAKLRGLRADGQLMAGTLAATLPMAVIQASSTQTDLVASLWLTCAVVFAIRYISRPNRLDLFFVGAGLALAAFTKMPALIFAAGVFLWFALLLFRKQHTRRTAVVALIVVGAVMALVNTPHYVRYAALTYRSLTETVTTASSSSAPLRSLLPFRYVNRTVLPSAIFSNLLRNAGVHLGLPNADWNTAFSSVIQRAHGALRIGENDPATTYPVNTYRGVRFSMHEDDAGNFIAFVLVIAATIWVLLLSPPARSLWLDYLGLVALCSLLFVLVLKWQPWHSRLQTPLFILAAPLVAAMFAALIGGRGSNLVSLLLLGFVLPYLAWNSPRPLVGDSTVLQTDRTMQYFNNNPRLQEPYRLAASYLYAHECAQVGLQMGGNDWEYPFWVLMGAHAGAAALRIEHVNVANASRLVESDRPLFLPCAIVAYRDSGAGIEYHGVTFEKRAEWQDVSVYEPVTIP